MTAFEPFLTPGQKQFLQRLRTDVWRRLADVGPSITERALTTINSNGWIERRGEGAEREFKLTQSGLEALKAKR